MSYLVKVQKHLEKCIDTKFNELAELTPLKFFCSIPLLRAASLQDLFFLYLTNYFRPIPSTKPKYEDI